MEFLIGLLVLSPFTAILVGFYAFYLIAKGKLEMKFNYWTTCLLLLFSWSMIVSIINKSWMSAGGSLLLLIYFLSSQFSCRILKNKSTLHKALNYLIFFSTIAAVIGILEKIVFAILGFGKHRIFSLFGNPNMTGSWFVTILFILVYMASQYNKTKWAKLYAISASLMVIAILLTGSRGSYVALVGTACIVGLIKGVTKSVKMLTITLLTVAIVFAVGIAQNKVVSEYVTAHPLEDSINPRMKIWKDGVSMFNEKPFAGWGILATFELGDKVLHEYNMKTIHVHNLWLSLLSSLGVVGLSIYLFMKVILYKKIYSLYTINRDLALMFLSINLVVIIQGLVDVSLFAPQIGILFVISGGMVTQLAPSAKISIDARNSKSVEISKLKTRITG